MSPRWQLFSLIALLGVVAAALLIGTSQPRCDVLHDRIAVQGETREYRLAIPRGADLDVPLPVVFAFHGAGDTADQMASYTGLDQLAEAHGCVVVYPQGRFQSWPSFISADNPTPVDRELAFFDALLDRLESRHRFDRNRVYAVGMSQGAAFVDLLVARRNGRLAAAVSHSGWLPKPLDTEGWNVEYPTPVLFILGGRDRQVSPRLVHAARDAFEQQGHPVQILDFAELGHRWATKHDINSRIWDFLDSHRQAEAMR